MRVWLFAALDLFIVALFIGTMLACGSGREGAGVVDPPAASPDVPLEPAPGGRAPPDQPRAPPDPCPPGRMDLAGVCRGHPATMGALELSGA